MVADIMMSSDAMNARVYDLWDDLDDYDASQIDAALNFLLRGLCELVDADNADWIGAVRLPAALPKETLLGWRCPAVQILHPTAELVAAIRSESGKIETGFSDEVIVRMVTMFGRFRARRLIDLAPEGWFESDFYRQYYLDSGRSDVIYVGFPVNDEAESYFGIFRGIGRPPFSESERDAVAFALRGLKWFHRRVLLSHGLLIAEKTLTPVERQVLKQLLGGLAEKQIAVDLGHSYHTTHEYVTGLYRKFGVNNRAALMALWLGRPA